MGHSRVRPRVAKAHVFGHSFAGIPSAIARIMNYFFVRPATVRVSTAFKWVFALTFASLVTACRFDVDNGGSGGTGGTPDTGGSCTVDGKVYPSGTSGIRATDGC